MQPTFLQFLNIGDILKRIDLRLRHIETQLNTLTNAVNTEVIQERNMNAQVQAAFDDLKAEVAATRGTVQSANTLMNGLSAQLAAALANGGNDPAALIAAITDVKTALDAAKDELAAGVVANAPVA